MVSNSNWVGVGFFTVTKLNEFRAPTLNPLRTRRSPSARRVVTVVGVLDGGHTGWDGQSLRARGETPWIISPRLIASRESREQIRQTDHYQNFL